MSSKCFTRGWTLQELLVPSILLFYSSTWERIGTRVRLAETISKATSIDSRLLTHGWDGAREYQPCAAVILHWTSSRVTSRVEDASYSLLGFFDVNMPLLYGERDKAFTRSQHEILRTTNDRSLFAWSPRCELDTAAAQPMIKQNSYTAASWQHLRLSSISIHQSRLTRSIHEKLTVGAGFAKITLSASMAFRQICMSTVLPRECTQPYSIHVYLATTHHNPNTYASC